MHKFKQIWSNLRSSFWFVLSLLVVANIAFAAALIETDTIGSDRWLAQWPRLFGAGADGARQMLSTLAGSMMSVMGITFSMTLVALALASSQCTRAFCATSWVAASRRSRSGSSPTYSLIVAHHSWRWWRRRVRAEPGGVLSLCSSALRRWHPGIFYSSHRLHCSGHHHVHRATFSGKTGTRIR